MRGARSFQAFELYEYKECDPRQQEKCSGVELRLPSHTARSPTPSVGRCRQGRALKVRAGNPNKDNDYLIDRAKGEDSQYPITGIACCACAASGHVATAPPSSVMNSRRFMSSMGTSSPMRYQPADRPVRPGAGRAHARHRLQRSAARPNSAPSKKRILCERRHIADAVAKLVSYLSIVPHMRSSDVPPKHSAPLTR